MKPREIVNAVIDRISLVDKAANRRKFVMLKKKKEDRMNLMELVKAGVLTEEDAKFLMKEDASQDADVIKGMKNILKSIAANAMKQSSALPEEAKEEILKSIKEQIAEGMKLLKAEADKLEKEKIEKEKAEKTKEEEKVKKEELEKKGTKETEADKKLEKDAKCLESLKKAESIDEILKAVKDMRGENTVGDLNAVETLTKTVKKLEEEITAIRKTSDQNEKSAKSTTQKTDWGGLFK